jgi:uncharacterized damage-inducible protein DinB
MLSPAHVRTMAAYNRAMNERVYEACAKLTDAERKRDAGAFFKSIHGTLNHLLVGDTVWMGRFNGRPTVIRSLDQELHADFQELRTHRVAMDESIVEWVGGLDAAKLSGELTYVSVAGNRTSTFPLWFALTHFFNHQTHHRGQVTTLLSQQGVDPGVTDLIAFAECAAIARGEK